MIHILGLGGVGFWLATALVRLWPATEITCWDDDTLAGGHGALRLPPAPPTTYKTELLLGTLAFSFGETIMPTIVRERFTAHKQFAAGDIIVDCTDMALTARKQMWGKARKAGAHLLRVSYDGRSSVVAIATGLPLVASAVGGYAAVPTLALSFAAGGLGAEVVKRFAENPTQHIDLLVNVGALFPTTPEPPHTEEPETHVDNTVNSDMPANQVA